MGDELGLALSPAEIFNLTHYKRPAEQIRVLGELGIPAKRRHDNTVCVLRAYVVRPPAADAAPRPQLRTRQK